jgi:hypothetical protein
MLRMSLAMGTHSKEKANPEPSASVGSIERFSAA